MSDTFKCACQFDPYTGEAVEECPRHSTMRVEIERLQEAIKELWVVCDYSQIKQLDPETAELVHGLVAEERYETTKVCVEGNAGSEPAEPFKSELQDAGFLPQTERPQWIGVDYGKDKSVTAYRCTYCKQVFVNEPPEHHECETEKGSE